MSGDDTNRQAGLPVDGHAFLAGGGKMGEAMRAHPWAATDLGEPCHWPQSLRTTVSLMLNSRFPMFCAWGDHLTMLYNDAYVPMLGNKHPRALGERFEIAWSDIWEQIEPLVRTAVSGEAIYLENLHIVMHRHGYEEDTWWTFSYSPIRRESGEVGGMFCACAETTQKVLLDRRILAQAERQARMLEQAPGFMAILTSPGHVYEYANAAYRKISAREVPIGARFGDVFPELPEMVGVLDKVYATGVRYDAHHELVPLRPAGGTPQDLYLDFIFQPITDDDGKVTGIFIQGHDVTKQHLGIQVQARHERHLRLLVDELNHRVKNTLSIVQGLAQQTFKGANAKASAREAFEGRLIALASAHNLLTNESWEAADLEDVVSAAITAHGINPERVLVQGPALRLEPKSAVMIAMAIHELTTNAVKYGALSDPKGRVTATWQFDQDRLLSLRWAERDGPEVVPPIVRGFGSRMIERALAAELRGDVKLMFEPTGVVCEIEARIPVPTPTQAPE